VKRLLKRTVTTEKVTKALPIPEPETSTEKGSTNVADKTQPMLGKCIECKQMPSSSESDHLCYDCHMSAKGFEYDGETNLYIKRRK
jgi:Zn finger protein HypA/HybF involved in hydrogenase expression